MKLYTSPLAPNPRRVRWVIAEKAISDIEIVQVDIMKGEHKTPEYLAKAGLPQVPALELGDGTVITESLAICRYLEALHPEPNLFGTDAKETAVIEMWTRRAEMLLATPMMLAVRHTHPALAALETPVPDLAKHQRATAERALRILDRRLGDSAYIAADRMTIADIVAVAALDFARIIKFKPDESLQNLAHWLEGMKARPAAQVGLRD